MTIATPTAAGRAPTRWPRSFRLLYTAAVAHDVGFHVGQLAVPVLAVSLLSAGPAQVGLLGALSTAAFLLVGLPAGVWVDRWPRRSVLVAADLLRAVLVASVPVAWWAGWLSIHQLYVVVFLTGLGTVFADVAAQSYLPELVGRDRLVAANSLLVTTSGTLQIAGRGVGGLLVQLLTAPAAIVLDAVGYAVAARPSAASPPAGHAPALPGSPAGSPASSAPASGTSSAARCCGRSPSPRRASTSRCSSPPRCCRWCSSASWASARPPSVSSWGSAGWAACSAP